MGSQFFWWFISAYCFQWHRAGEEKNMRNPNQTPAEKWDLSDVSGKFMGLKPSFLDDTCWGSLSVTPASIASGPFHVVSERCTIPCDSEDKNIPTLLLQSQRKQTTEEKVYPLPGSTHSHAALESFSSSTQGQSNWTTLYIFSID